MFIAAGPSLFCLWQHVRYLPSPSPQDWAISKPFTVFVRNLACTICTHTHKHTIFTSITFCVIYGLSYHWYCLCEKLDLLHSRLLWNMPVSAVSSAMSKKLFVLFIIVKTWFDLLEQPLVGWKLKVWTLLLSYWSWGNSLSCQNDQICHPKHLM